jgi:hypothetical protein
MPWILARGYYPEDGRSISPRNVDNHLPDSRSQNPEYHNINFHESINITNNFHKTIVGLVRDKGNSADF